MDKAGVDNVDIVDNVSEGAGYEHICKKIIHSSKDVVHGIELWIMWIIYFFRSASPIFTIFPAPIVINKSFSLQFVDKKFSISSKVGK